MKNAGGERVIKKIILTGGVARASKTIRKLIMNCFGCEIVISPYSEEAAVGAALIARKKNRY